MEQNPENMSVASDAKPDATKLTTTGRIAKSKCGYYCSAHDLLALANKFIIESVYFVCFSYCFPRSALRVVCEV